MKGPVPTTPEWDQGEEWHGRFTWRQIGGWFNYAWIYDAIVAACLPGAHLVEVGSWKGRSTCYMGAAIRRSGKAIRFDAVDAWGLDWGEAPEKVRAANAFYNHFLDNVNRCGLTGYIHPVRARSVEAAARYDDRSLDFVYIDADHQYESVVADLAAWRPKLRRGGLIAGHDYQVGNPLFDGLIRAVDECFAGGTLEVHHESFTWYHKC